MRYLLKVSFGLFLLVIGSLTGRATELSPKAKAVTSVRFSRCLELLEVTNPGRTGLVQAVGSLIRSSKLVDGSRPEPSLMIVTFRDQKGKLRDLVVQTFDDTQTGKNVTLNPEGTVRDRLGNDLYASADNLLSLLYHQVNYLGDRRAADLQQRAFEAGVVGDLTFLRELTVDPLRVVAIMPRADKYLPSSLRGRVRSIVVNSDLSLGTWKSQMNLVTADEPAAEQVGTMVAAWRDMASSLADTFASANSGKPLRDAIKSSSVQVVDTRVVAETSVPATTVVRATKEITGHAAPRTVAVCHKGRTILVSEAAVDAHLAHGDTLGPCPATICHKGRTIKVAQEAVAAHVAHGDTVGECPAVH